MSIPTPGKMTTLALMRKYGIRKATIHFSGGNDEGYAEPAALEMQPGFETPALDQDHWQYIAPADRFTIGSPRYEDNTPDMALLAAGLEAPIDHKYGSFAGDFYVDGDVVWDAETGTCVMDQNVETPSWTNEIDEL